MSFRVLAGIVTILIGIGLLAGLGLAIPKGTQPTAGVTGDTLLLVYSDDPDTLNPITSSDTVSEAFQRQVYEYLADRDFANPDKWAPKLATSWEFDPKTLEYTIHLRRGVMWHPMRLPNGKLLPEAEFTAADVKFTFDVILNPHVEAASLRSYYEDPDAKDESQRYKIKVSVVDKYTVKVRWTKPYFMSKEFTLSIGMIPRHVFSVDQNGEPIALNTSLREFADGFNQHWANTQMCGTGPMMYKRWIRNQRLVLVRNPKYWDKPFPFERLIYRSIPNSNTSTQMVLKGDLDLAAIPDKDQYLQKKSHPDVVPGKMVTVQDPADPGAVWEEFRAASPGAKGTVKFVEYPYPGYRYIGYNLRRKLFEDVRVRRALSHAVPVETIINQVFKGLAIPNPGPFTPGSSAFDKGIEPIAYDLEAARKLLSEAGWQDLNRDGVREKTIDGVVIPAQFELMIYSDSASFRTVAEIVKENARKIGVNVLVSPTKWALFLQKLNNHEFDAAMLGWGGVWQEDPFQIWHGSKADEPYSSNFIGYRNAEVDKLIEKLRVTLDEKEQIPLYHEIHRRIYEDQPYTFLFSEKATGAYSARLDDVRFYRIRPCTKATEWRALEARDLGTW